MRRLTAAASALVLWATLPALRAAAAGTVWRFDGACTASTRAVDKGADPFRAKATPIACQAAVLIGNPDGIAVLSAGTSGAGGSPISFGSVDFRPAPVGGVITMPIDEVAIGGGGGRHASGTCRLYGPEIGAATEVSCAATVVDGTRRTAVDVEVRVGAVHVLQSK